jgi:hypothetical protein
MKVIVPLEARKPPNGRMISLGNGMQTLSINMPRAIPQ